MEMFYVPVNVIQCRLFIHCYLVYPLVHLTDGTNTRTTKGYYNRKNKIILYCTLYVIVLTIFLNSILYWTQYGIEHTIVLNTLLYRTQYGIEHTMVLGALVCLTRYAILLSYCIVNFMFTFCSSHNDQNHPF